jgi:dihydrofolate reductase
VVHGSGKLIQTLMQNDLVDTYRLLVYPLVLGKGQRLFEDGTKTNLKLVDSRTFSSGVVALVYQPDRSKTK